jgi:hypothetical protein
MDSMYVLEQESKPVLPDFLGTACTKMGKNIYQMTSKYTAVHKVYQMAVKCTNIYNSKAIPKTFEYGDF